MTNNVINEPEWLKESINLGNKVDIAFWCKMLRCKEEDLIWAVHTIGNSPRSVNSFLELNRMKNS